MESLKQTPAEAGKFWSAKQQALDNRSWCSFAQVGDLVGGVVFTIAGSLLANGANGSTASTSSGCIYSASVFRETGLSQKGSRINYRYYFRYDKRADIKKS